MMNVRIYQINTDKDTKSVKFENLENTLNIAGQVNNPPLRLKP